MTRLAVVVDDDPVSQLIVQHVLTRAEWDVRTAASKDEALGLLEALSAAPDVILCDFHMPGGSGLDLFAELDDRYANVPFLLLTGVDEQTDVRDERIDDITAYLTKPVHSTELLEAIDTALDQCPTPEPDAGVTAE